MARIKRNVIAFLMGIVMTLALIFGVALSLPAAKAKAETLPTTGWTLAYEGDHRFRIQNGNTYWSENTNSVTTASMLDYTEINGKTLTEINEETPGAVSVTLQPAGGSIGSFYRVNIDTEISGFTVNDIGTVVIRSGWSHTDGSGTYTIDTDLYFAHGQNKWASDSNNWKYIPKENVVDISDAIQLDDQGIQAEGTRAILLKTSNNNYWTGDPITPNEGGGSFLNMLYINGTSIKEWNKKAHAALEAGEITDISYGSEFWLVDNGPSYAPIAVSNSAYIDGLGSISQIWIPTGYIDNVASFKIAKGFANLQGDTLYYVSKDIEYAKSGGSFTKISSTVDISDAFHLLVQDYTASNGTMLYYLHTNNVKYWTAQYGTAGDYAINESEWKGVNDVARQGGAVQMSFLEFNGTPIYDINANDNGAYGATQGNIASGSKYAPILAFLTPKELGSAIKLQVPSQYPSGSGAAADNHQTITIKRGFFVVDTTTNIKYEVTRDIQWDYENGVWNEHVEKIYTTVDEAKLVWDDGAFVAISLTGDKYADASNTWAGDIATALSYAKSSNFYNYVLLNGEVITEPAEAFLNVWSNYGYFTFRTHGFSSDVASGINEITIKAGCQIPTYNALATGANEVYVVTEDVTFIKDGNGDWVKDDGYIDAGEYATGVKSINYARDGKSNWMLIGLTEKDYPSAATVYNVATKEEQMSALNLYDKIIVDGYTLRSRISQYGNPIEAPKINLWQANCLGIRISGAAGALDGAQKVTIRAGAQFPSYAYIMGGVEAYYVTSKEYTFVNVGAASGEWERQYTAKFVADGETVETVEYLVSQGLPYIPEVPEKDGYAGRWESYTANGNIIVNAVYTVKANVLGTTSLKEIRRIDNNSNHLVINPTVSDYPESVAATWNLGLDVSYLEKFNLKDYITINGKTLRELGVSSMTLNKFTRAGLGLETALSNSMTIVIQKGCEIPSYAFWKNPDSEASCYVMDTTYTCVYDAGGETAFTITSDKADSKPSGFANHYTLFDLYDVAESKSDCFKDGWETLTDKGATEESYRYGYLDSFQDFTLTFDFSFTGAAYYNSFSVQLGTEDHGGNKGHFGWRFYLLRGDSEKGTVTPDMCVEFFSATCDYAKYENGNIKNDTFGREAFQAGRTYRITIGYQLIDATKGTVRFYAAIDGIGVYNEAELGGDFATFAPYLQSLTMSTNTAQTVTVSDPSYEGNFENVNKLTLNANGKAIVETYTNGYVLPALSPEDYGMGGNVFVGWTTDTANLSNLYPAGHPYAPNGNETLYAVWLGFKMQNGAGVRIDESKPSGIRFLIDIDQAGYEFGVSKGLIKGIGTIIAPTSYLTDNELTHALGAGYYIERSVDTWQQQNACYSVALVGISADQYARSFSARGYLKVQYTTGEGYIYTSYNEADHARSIYDVATSAYNDDKKDYKNNEAILGYVNAVADVTVSDDLASVTKNGVGNYTVSAAKNGDILTLTVNNPVKAVVINGTRIMMGYDADVVIGGMRYTVSGFALNIGGTTISFAIGEGNEQAAKKYYISLLENWKNRTDYTAEHYAKICSVADKAIADIENGAKATWKEIYETAVATLETVKTGAELAENVGESTLATPVAARGDGYAVTWNAVENADYYIVSDTNDYRDYVVVYAGETLSYRAEVVGEHEVSVTAYSYYDSYRTSAASNAVATPEVKQAFSYKALSDGLYKFSSSQMSTMGLSNIQSNCYYDKEDKKYFAYYNVDTKSWSPYPSMATDWSSPKYFLAHAKRLKEMGNNVILIPHGTNAMFREGEVWETSRLKYVMDTAWSIGMKIIVCDEVLYDLSMSDGSGTGATSKAQVTSAIGASKGFNDYIKHPAFYGFSFDDEPYGKYLSAMSYTIQAIDEACDAVEVYPFYLACLFQAQGGDSSIEMYSSQSSLKSYYDKWLKILTDCGIAKEKQYLYVDIYTQHAMGQPTDRYNTSFEVIYDDDYFKGEYDFYQALTAHTQNTDYIIYEKQGELLEQDLYASMLYGAAHDIKGYSWFCFFPISGELSGSLAGYDGEGYGNGLNDMNGASGCYYNAAKIAAKQFELIQGWLYGYDWKTRGFSNSDNLLTTTLSNGSNTATMYVLADMDSMSASVTVTVSGKKCYKVGYGVGTADQPYEVVSGSVTLQPGQAVLCV